MASPIETFSLFATTFSATTTTPYRVRIPGGHEGRRLVLDRPGVTWQEPWLEVVRNYALTGLGAEALFARRRPTRVIGILTLVGSLALATCSYIKKMLWLVLVGRNVAVTAGTGSGKTEAFLLPIVAALLSESNNWMGTSPSGASWWRSERTRWVPRPRGEWGVSLASGLWSCTQ